MIKKVLKRHDGSIQEKLVFEQKQNGSEMVPEQDKFVSEQNQNWSEMVPNRKHLFENRKQIV